MNYKKGEFTKFVEGVKRLVERGEMTKEDAVIITLNKVVEVFANINIDKEQFMKERTYEAANYN